MNKIRQNGIHYTNYINTMRVIYPLFLNSWCELLIQKKLCSEYLSKCLFLDPACGEGNLLYNTFTECNRVLGESGNSLLKESQFVGYDIDEDALTVFRKRLPGALAVKQCGTEDWQGPIKNKDFRHVFIIMNPPFAGTRTTSSDMKLKLNLIYKKLGFEKYKSLDLSCFWLLKAFIFKTEHPETLIGAIVTNSVNQGIQVPRFWGQLGNVSPKVREAAEITFAHKDLEWSGDANVVVNILGFGSNSAEKRIYKYDVSRSVEKKRTRKTRKQIIDSFLAYQDTLEDICLWVAEHDRLPSLKSECIFEKRLFVRLKSIIKDKYLLKRCIYEFPNINNVIELVEKDDGVLRDILSNQHQI